MQRATLAQLRQEYQLRLDQAHTEIDLMRRKQRLIQQLLAKDKARLPELEKMLRLARRAYRANNISALSYLNMQSTLVEKQIEELDLEQAL